VEFSAQTCMVLSSSHPNCLPSWNKNDSCLLMAMELGGAGLSGQGENKSDVAL